MTRLTPSKKEKQVVQISFWVVFLNSVLESFLFYFDDRYSIVLLQTTLNFSFFSVLVFKNFQLRIAKEFSPILILVFYFMVACFFSTEPIHSVNMFLKFTIPIFFLLIGYSFSTPYLLYYFINKSWIFLAYFCCYLLLVNYYQIGNDLYRGGFKIGFNSLNSLYIPVFSIIIVLFFINYIKNNSVRIVSFILAGISFVIFLVLLKRTLVVLLFIALFFHLLYNLSRKTFAFLVLFLLMVTTTFYSFFYVDFLNTYDSRQNYFDEDYSIAAEGRVTENFYMLSIMKESPASVIFGTGEVFNDRKYLSYSYFDRSRELHNSYARIFWNGGIVGLSLFLYFYWIQGKIMFKTLSILKEKQSPYRQVYLFGFVLILLRILNDLSSGITYLGFNAFCYLLIGCLVRQSKVVSAVYQQIKLTRRARKKQIMDLT